MKGPKESSLTIGVLGCGQMAQSIVKGLFHAAPKGYHFHTYTPSGARAQQLALDVGGESHPTLEQFPACDLYLVACKPQQFPQLAEQMRRSSLQRKEALYVSIMAGVTIESCQRELPETRHWVRTMPNTPGRILQGATLMALSQGLPEDKKDIALCLFQKLGRVFPLEHEEDMDYLTGVTGSGPAFIFELARIFQELLIQKAHPHRVDPQTARNMVQQTFLGASMLMEQESASLAELRDQVTSKGGVTYAGLQVFAQENLEQILEKALEAAYQRSLQLKTP